MYEIVTNHGINVFNINCFLLNGVTRKCFLFIDMDNLESIKYVNIKNDFNCCYLIKGLGIPNHDIITKIV